VIGHIPKAPQAYSPNPNKADLAALHRDAASSLHSFADRIFVTYTVTIHASDRSVTREATGTEVLKEPVPKNPTQMRELAYGDPSSNAESMAFRRAAAKHGLGLYLYYANQDDEKRGI
jgi:hypothetical protein